MVNNINSILAKKHRQHLWDVAGAPIIHLIKTANNVCIIRGLPWMSFQPTAYRIMIQCTALNMYRVNK